MATLKVQPSGREVPVSAVVSLLNTLLREDIPISHDCGGRAQCGTCRIKIRQGAHFLSPPTKGELTKLGETPLEEGYRLACQTHTAGDVTIEIPPKEPHGNR